jgi:hypothetical protein
MSLNSIPKEYLQELQEVMKTEKFREIKAIVNKLNSDLAAMAVFSSEDKALGRNSVQTLLRIRILSIGDDVY